MVEPVQNNPEFWDAVVHDTVDGLAIVPEAEVVEGWEYMIKVLPASLPDVAEHESNILGRDNWELFYVRTVDVQHANEVWYYYKRRTG